MTLICGTICTGSFCTALGTAKNHAFRKLDYADKPVFKGNITTVSDIENYARSKNCTFLFYEGGNNAQVKEARKTLNDKKYTEKQIVEHANKVKKDCTENSFVFAKMNKIT